LLDQSVIGNEKRHGQAHGQNTAAIVSVHKKSPLCFHGGP
jgi:hypothetical protein